MSASGDETSQEMVELDYSIVHEKPGHGYELDIVCSHISEVTTERFPNAILDTGYGGAVLKLITLREIAMLGLINAVTDKPDWTTKVFDEAIIAKWKLESMDSELPDDQQLTEAMFEYSIKELQYRAKHHEASPRGAIPVFPGDVVKSDTAVSEATKLALQQAVRVLEEVPADKKDWHPGSGGKVLDLVHPSLFPLIYGVSRILPLHADITTLDDCIKRCGEGDVIDKREPYTDEHGRILKGQLHSTKFQWLPCEVDVSGEKPRILTYINNLHPIHHREVYTVIEDIIAAALPLCDLTLAPIADLEEYTIPRRIPYTEVTTLEGEIEEPKQEDDEDEEAWETRYAEWQDIAHNVSNHTICLPEPEEFRPLPLPQPLSLVERFGNTKPLQIIVKLANIELTPGKPEYEGGSWHIEGQMNESICASAIYYYSTYNVTTSKLAFRQQAQDPTLNNEIGYENGLYHWPYEVFGIDTGGMSDYGNTVQTLGSVETREGRLVTFPNILQHQVQPFKLEDPTKPGHRKILALFLVDPNLDVITTADVPVQRLDWWAEEVVAAVTSGAQNKLGLLPAELRDMVLEGDHDDKFPINMEQAKTFREELMDERKSFVISNNDEFEATSISLCEH